MTDRRVCLLHLGLGHAVEMQVPPVGHVRQQVAVVDRVAVQVHTLGLDEQDDVWGPGGDVSARENLRDMREQRQTPTVQQVLRKLLQNVFHTQRVSAVQPIKQVLCQFRAAFVISAVNSLNKHDEMLFSGPNRKQRQTADQGLTEGAEDSVGGGGLAVLEQSLDLAQAAAAAGRHTKLLVLW